MKVTINVTRNDLLSDITGSDNTLFFSKLEEIFAQMLTEKKYLPDGVESVEISLAVLTSAEMQDVNFEFRELRESTDVLSFPLWEEDEKFTPPADWEPLPLGDIVICPAAIQANAESAGKTFAAELALVILHGFLHLIGWDHDTQEKEDAMWAEQDRILSAGGF